MKKDPEGQYTIEMEISKQAGILTLAGIKQMQTENYAGAIQKFDEAIATHPGSIHALQGRAFCKSILCITNPQLAPNEIRRYTKETIEDLESTIKELRILLSPQ